MGMVKEMSEQEMLDHLVYLGYLERKETVCRYPVAGVMHERTTVHYQSERELIRDTERGIL